MKKALIGILVVALVGFVAWKFIPEAEDVTAGKVAATTGEAKAVDKITAGEGKTEIPLTADQVVIGFQVNKTIAGKQKMVSGGWEKDFNSVVTGTLLVDNAAAKILQMHAEIEIKSLWSEHDMLTEALLTKGFFKPKEFPTATFVTTEIKEGAPELAKTNFGATHEIVGNLKINGIEKSITFPAKISVAGPKVSVDSKFTLNRKDFGMIFEGSSALNDSNISNDVAMSLAIKTGSSKTEAASEDSKLPKAAVDASKLPATYTDKVPFNQVPFNMVLIPGDEAKGIKPFYFGRTEVSWDEFLPWVMCEDLTDPAEPGKQRAKLLRPSTPYQEITRGFGQEGFPALSMSKLSAGLYCKWLSAATGRTYRLPTEKEWLYAYELGRAGKSKEVSADEAEKIAIYLDNAMNDDIGDLATRHIGSKAPNAIHLYDMAGNVAEWVDDTGEERVARGGHFESDISELGVGRHVENEDIWNMGYPNYPKSIWWFVDARWVGFRLVCEPDASILDLPTEAVTVTP